jgi:hypothetical protein
VKGYSTTILQYVCREVERVYLRGDLLLYSIPGFDATLFKFDSHGRIENVAFSVAGGSLTTRWSTRLLLTILFTSIYGTVLSFYYPYRAHPETKLEDAVPYRMPCIPRILTISLIKGMVDLLDPITSTRVNLSGFILSEAIPLSAEGLATLYY